MPTITINHNGTYELANISEEGARILEALKDTPRGSFGFVKDHVSGTAGEKGCITPEKSDRLFLTQVRYDKYLQRKRLALKEVTIDDVVSILPRHIDPKYDFFRKVEAEAVKRAKKLKLDKVEELDINNLFVQAKATLALRYEGQDKNTQGQREGQTINYGAYNGFRLKLQTVKQDGVMRPLVDGNGRLTVTGIMIPFYEVKRTVHQKAEYKPVNSGIDKIMRDTIERAMSRKGIRTAFKSFNLLNGNFQKISLNSAQIFGMVKGTETAQMDAELAHNIRDIAELDDLPLAVLAAEAEETIHTPVG
jgi:hypothetical protein